MIESGQRPNPTAKTVTAIAGVLGVPVGWLVSGAKPVPNQKQIVTGALEARKAAGLVPSEAPSSGA